MDLLPALGTGNDDASLPTGNPAYRPALGAGNVLVLPIPHPGPGQAEGIFYRPAHLAHEPRILRPALGQIPGEHPPQRPQHHGRRQGGQDQIRHLIPLDEQTHHVDDNGRPDGGQSQPISAVAAVHEPGHSVADPLEETHTLASFL